MRELTDAGINVGVLMAPIVPGFTSSRSKVERTIKTIAEDGARFVGCNVMYLEACTRRHFMSFLEEAFPAMAPRIDRLYRKKAPPAGYQHEVKAMVRSLQERYGLQQRVVANDVKAGDRREESEDESAEPEQVGFRW